MEKTSDLLEAQAHIWNHTFSFINSEALKCAVQLGIPDIIHHHGQPMTLPHLVTALQINPLKSQFIHRIMSMLAHSGFFTLRENDGETLYNLTATSHLLLKDNPFSVSPFLLSMLDPALVNPWQSLSTWLKNDESTLFHTTNGRTFWEHLGKEKMFGDGFNEAMASDARLVANVLVVECKSVFEGLESLVDVGGGTGTVARTVADTFPNIMCTVFDLPRVVDGLVGSGNLKFIGGDLFEAIPPADCFLLKWMFHAWGDEDCIKILKKCREAINPNKAAKLIVIEMVVDTKKRDEKSAETQLLFDMMMMGCVTGIERNENQWAKLFYDAGYGGYKIFPLLGLRSLIEVYP